MRCRRPGRLFPFALLATLFLPAGAAEPPDIQASKAANRARIWTRQIFVSVRGEPIDHLAAQVGQQLMTRVRAEDGIAHRPVSAYAADCTVAQLCDGLAAAFGYHLVPYAAAESVHFQLETGAARKAVAKKAGAPRSGAKVAKTPAKPAPKDPRLLRKLDLSALEVDDEEGGLPVILEALSQAAQIPILADHAGASPARPPKGPSQFLTSLHGLPLAEALDRTARAHNYRWAQAGGWFLFKPVR